MSSWKIAKNTVYYGVIPKLTVLANIVILPLITPYLTTYDYGVFGVLSSYTGLLLCIAPLGLNLHLTNSFFEIPNKYNLVWGRIYTYFLLSGLLFGLVNIILLLFVLPFESVYHCLLLAFFGTMQIFLFASSKLADHLFPYIEKPKPLVFTNLFSALGGIIISFILIFYYRLGYWGLIASSSCSSILAFSVFAYILYSKYQIRPLVEHNVRRCIKMVKQGLPLIPHTLGFVLLSSSARIVMGFYNVNYDEIGLFSHGSQMGTYVVTVTTAFVVAISPQMQRFYRSGDYTKYRNLFYLSQGVSIIASFLLCLWMSELYGILIKNDSISQSSSIATLMCFAQSMMPLYHFMSVSCFIERNAKQLLWLVFVPGITNLVLCYLLIPFFGYKVAVYSTMFSYWTQILIPFMIPYYKVKTSLWLGNRLKLAIVMILIVLFLISGNVLVNISIFYKMIITAFVGIASLFIYRRSRLSYLFN